MNNFILELVVKDMQNRAMFILHLLTACLQTTPGTESCPHNLQSLGNECSPSLKMSLWSGERGRGERGERREGGKEGGREGGGREGWRGGKKVVWLIDPWWICIVNSTHTVPCTIYRGTCTMFIHVTFHNEIQQPPKWNVHVHVHVHVCSTGIERHWC